MTDPIRVFVGAGPEQRVPFLVLKSSIERRASRPVEVRNLLDFPEAVAPTPKDPANRPRTPFSFQRFAIPHLCNYQGRAIYLDSDMVVLDDIASLWDFGDLSSDLAFQDRPAFLATNVEPSARNAVLVIDCERAFQLRDLGTLVWWLDSQQATYKGLMEDLRLDGPNFTGVEDDWLGPVLRIIPARWNRLDEFVPGDTSLLHFTDMRRQPWRKRGHPLEGMWLEEKDAMENALDDKAERDSYYGEDGHEHEWNYKIMKCEVCGKPVFESTGGSNA